MRLILFQKNQRTLNTYVRFEEIKSIFRSKKKILIKIFLEMEPKFKNKIYVKDDNVNINLSPSKKDIQVHLWNCNSINPSSWKMLA